jgi:predicted O-methyltransferase YrrM
VVIGEMDFSSLVRLASGHVEARIVQSAVELGIFDALEASPLDAGTIAATLKLDLRAAELLLNALAALQLLVKEKNSFSLTEISERHLLKSAPHYLGGMIRFDASLWPCWERLPEAIRSGAPARPPNMYQDDPNETATFINAMDSLVKARGDTEVLASVLDWTKVKKLLDIGSGPATYPIALCARFPNLRATVFDLPETLKITESYVKAAAMAERIELIAGDYQKDSVPKTFDMIFLSNIIHGEGYEENLKLMAKLAASLQPGGRIIIKDHILDESRVQPPVGAIFSLLMLLTTASGRCYSFEEVKAWLESAGLSQVQRIDLPPPLTSSLIVAEK